MKGFETTIPVPSSLQILKGKNEPIDVENIWYCNSGNSGNIVEILISLGISAFIIIKSSSSGKLYFCFNIFSHSDKSTAVVCKASSLESSSFPYKYFAIFSNSNLTEVNSIEILLNAIIFASGKLYIWPLPK